jgi:hypothetical protein
MINFSGGHNNWWTINIYPQKKPLPSLFDMTFNHDSVQHMTFQDAADSTAQLIGKYYNNLYLAMSGGLDSEFVAEVLYRNNIPFTPIIAAVEAVPNTYINYDYFRAIHWCEQKKIKPVVIFYTQDDPRLVKQCLKLLNKVKDYTPNIALLDLIDQVEQLNGQIIIGDPTLPRGTEGYEYHDPIGPIFDTDFLGHFCEIFDSDNRHPGGFFAYTPELLLAFARELDITLNESAAKTKLYGVPYRPKTFSVESISQKILDNMYYLYNLEQYSEMPSKYWKKQELIDLLVK